MRSWMGPQPRSHSSSGLLDAAAFAQLPTPTIATRIFLAFAGVAGAKATLAWLAFAASLLIFSLTLILAPLCEAAGCRPVMVPQQCAFI